MRNLLLKSSIVLIFIAFFVISCKRDPCINIPELDEYSNITKEWFTNDSIGNRPLIDLNGIKQTLELTTRRINARDESMEDGCGNVYGSFSFYVDYKTSISSHDFYFIVRGGSHAESFNLELRYYNSQTTNGITTSYNFIDKSCSEGNATITYLEDLQTVKKKYDDVLKITFNSRPSINDAKTVYYSKSYGLIKFTQGNGNEYEID